jgi:hypothetical protein
MRVFGSALIPLGAHLFYHFGVVHLLSS